MAKGIFGTLQDWTGSFLFDKTTENILSLFGINQSKSESTNKGMKSGFGGVGDKDEAIVLLGDYNALPEEWRNATLQPTTISLIAEAFRDGLTPLQRGKIEKICGLREDTISSKEYWLDRDGKKVDESTPPAGGKGKGPQKVTRVIEKEMQNQTGKHIMILFFAIGNGSIGKKPTNQTYNDPEKREIFKKSIPQYLKNRGIIRDFSDQVDEVAREADESAKAILSRFGIHGTTEELKEKSEDFLQNARLKLEMAKAKAGRR